MTANIPLIAIDGSTQLTHIGHCAASKTLVVHFKGGGTYSYHPVDPEDFEKLMAAESKGSHLHRFIKPGRTYEKVEAE